MDLKNYPILNVDDYAPGLYARSKILRQAGFNLFEATTGSEALELVIQKEPALVLLDVNLPDMSGFEVCRRIRANVKVAGTTVVHISASSIQTQHQVRGLDMGADSYLIEPVDPSVLVATVKAFLRAREAEDALRKSNEDLQRFAYVVAHELNEPLRTVIAHTQLLQRSVQEGNIENTLEGCQFVIDGAHRMRSFVNDLLSYSQTSHAGPDISEFGMEAILARVLANLKEMIELKGAQITHDPLPTIIADLRIEHVLQNIISNGVKYSRPGVPPELHVSAKHQTGAWLFSISDNGIGIEPRYKDGIFQIFRRLHGRETPGHGIGLALCKTIVEANGGALWIESEPGSGSTFYFTVPEQPVKSKL